MYLFLYKSPITIAIISLILIEIYHQLKINSSCFLESPLKVDVCL